jgi:Na+/melibiose symporter-like transporter
VGEASAATTTAAPKSGISVWTKLAYGFGSVAYGVKDNGFAYFLLIFYSQVVGLNPLLVAPALGIALALDAISDPIVGYWSDNLRSRWGRRHPFMYASAIPLGLTYALLWNPPIGWSQMGLFWYLLSLAVLIRTFITFYETPSSAMAPELSQSYDERSSLLSYRYYFAWTGGNLMTVLMFSVLFPMFATAVADGQFKREAYTIYSIIGSVLIFVAIGVSSVGTHSRIPHMMAPPPKRKLTLGKIFKEIFDTLFDRSFGALFVATIFGAIAAGLSAALALYFLLYFWGFTAYQNAMVTGSIFLSAVLGSLMAPYVTRTLGKKRGAMITGLIAFIGSPLPMVLRLTGILPEGTGPFVFWFVLISGMIDVGLIICFQILAASMIADLVEQAELKTGVRSEGIFFAAVTFIRKMVTSIGVSLAGVVLAVADFPAGAKPGDVSPDAIWRLGAYYVPAILALWMAMMAAISTYRLDRSGHEENLRQLAVRKEKA